MAWTQMQTMDHFFLYFFFRGMSKIINDADNADVLLDPSSGAYYWNIDDDYDDNDEDDDEYFVYEFNFLFYVLLNYGGYFWYSSFKIISGNGDLNKRWCIISHIWFHLCTLFLS